MPNPDQIDGEWYPSPLAAARQQLIHLLGEVEGLTTAEAESIVAEFEKAVRANDRKD